MSRRRPIALIVCAWLAMFCPAAAVPPAQTETAAETTQEYRPNIAAASDEGQRAIKSFLPARGLKVELYAAEPHVANVVAFTFDERGRMYTAETFRQNQNTGAEDNRSHPEWLDDDLAAQSIEDRLAYLKKHRPDLSSYTREQDRIRLVEDTDGDGRADRATVFADGFNDVLDGTGAGVLVRGQDVFYTCIPHLWRLRDTDGDGRADERTALHRGYGVRYAFRGHDMHGLIVGPDGKLYYSIGDRGFNVETPIGRLAQPDRGAVFRCNLDGSELEVVHLGLRNPQELAFDEFGNLFTGDNNSDSGDRARWVQIVDGGDSGWRMYFQYLGDRGPWNREKLWYPQHEGQAAYIVPPIINITDGPAGVAYYPGTGLSDEYRGRFLLCDFRGSSGQSGVHSFRLKPKGASFELIDHERFLWSILATDVAFGPDCGVYVSDWVEGWVGPGKGRVYRVVDPERYASDEARQVRQLLAEGFARRPTEELVALLSHGDMRVRQESQFALADRGAVEPFVNIATSSKHPVARLHAIWGLGQISRQRATDSRPKPLGVLDTILRLAADADAEVRAQVAHVLSYRPYPPAVQPLVAMLADESPRVRMFAALALGRQEHRAVDAIFEMLDRNDDADPYVRHAAVVALSAVRGDEVASRAKTFTATQTNPAVRMGVVLALRRQRSPVVTQFLADPLPRIADEAARAIHDDAGIDEAWPALAEALDRLALSDPTTRRALNANYRLGGEENARRVAAYAARSDAPEHLRVEALQMLANWEKPSPKDRVTGMWRPLKPRSAEVAVAALRPVLGSVIGAKGNVGREAARAATALGIREIGSALVAIFDDPRQAVAARAEALAALAQLRDPHTDDATQRGLDSDSPVLRAAALGVLAATRPDAAPPKLSAAMEQGSIAERQAAVSAAASLKTVQADNLIATALDRLIAGSAPPETHLDILEAAQRRATEPLRAKLAEFESQRDTGEIAAGYVESMYGGDAERGRRLFFEGSSTSCVRCHRSGGVGGLVGPDLTAVAKDVKHDRRYLLESIVAPNKAIAEGFQTTNLALADGQVTAGIVKSEAGGVITLITPEGKLLTIDADEVDQRRNGPSAMPDDLIKHLSKSQLRDLVEYLSTLK
ncbi:MAG: PVC-type heme-binding CxxCH protein [Pirellulales bacterium]